MEADDPDSLQTHTRSIFEKAVYTTAMPEDQGIAIADREQLGEWLARGAP